MKNLGLIKYLNQHILNKYNDFKGTYLFGSRVKGDYNQDSDWDVLVLFDKINRDKKLEIYGIIGEAEYKFNVFIDVKILTSDEFKINPFFNEEVINKGIFYGTK